MIGTAVVSLPWAYQQAGLVLSIIFTTISFGVCYYTCNLMYTIAKDDPNFETTLKKYFGMPGYIIGLIAPIGFCFGVLIVIFIIMSQLLYAIILACVSWIAGVQPVMSYEPTFSEFSPGYTSVMLFVFLFILCNVKDMTILNKLQSVGALFIIFLIIFMIGTGIYGLTNTEYRFVMTGAPTEDWSGDSPVRTLVMFNLNFSPLIGMLCVAYNLHHLGLPIVKTHRFPEKISSDLFITYSLVFLTYIAVGIFGYIGFTGLYFNTYYASKNDNLIDQNCMNMYAYDNILAFILRLFIFILVFFSYPMVNFVARKALLNLFYRKEEVTYLCECSFNFMICIPPLLFSLFYPNIGKLLAYIGAVTGFIC